MSLETKELIRSSTEGEYVWFNVSSSINGVANIFGVWDWELGRFIPSRRMFLHSMG